MACSMQLWPIVAIVLSAFTVSSLAAAAEYVRLQGTVLCQDCQSSMSGEGTLPTQRTPLQGAFVALRCEGGEDGEGHRMWVGRTSASGKWIIDVDGSLLQRQSCKVSVLSSPIPRCAVKTDVNFGSSGSIPILDHSFSTTLAPFVFKPYYCH
ncbi:hypothetical protein KP509_24G024000 [Ceratopteris richardii]|uniref:Uncharacterized protein n=1 Tax=Ceratopteris richardii TaxID=49495 RepID=A0A8T2RUU6_CERRI|nr:hypothetical protein KP509_24G024000 [Ceratopteris richardii]